MKQVKGGYEADYSKLHRKFKPLTAQVPTRFRNKSTLLTRGRNRFSLTEKPTRVRFDFNTGLIDQFKFVLMNIGTRFWVVKYQINFIGGAVKTINVNQPGAQNQSQYYRNY